MHARAGVAQLDTIMRNKYARQPAKLHAWERASRVERSPRAAQPPPVPVPSPTP